MRSVVFLGPSKISGIGQVTRKWATLYNGDFVELGYPLERKYDVGFAFILPVDGLMSLVKMYEEKCKRMIYYTICETEPVNEAYGKLQNLSKTLYTSSQFCADVLSKQFPDTEWKVLKLYAFPQTIQPSVSILPEGARGKYIFYHIGNIIDQRKNMNTLIDVFSRMKDMNVALVLKATCKWQVSINTPNVFIINDFLNDEQMESLHEYCNCYVSCSHSEGAGMGAVEAAMRDKPVIIQEYGATKEYVKTPWVIPCTKVPVGTDDFLFKKEHQWGLPDPDVLYNYMVHVYTEDIREWDHSFTRSEMVACERQLRQLLKN